MAQRGRSSLAIGFDNDSRSGQPSTSGATPNLGTTRNRTELFLKYRRHARKSSQAFDPTRTDTGLETVRLMASALGGISDVEAGLPAGPRPQYVDFKEEVRADMLQIREGMKELKALHGRAALSKFDDGREDEVEVEVLTQQITKMFRKCEARLQKLNVPSGPQAAEDDKVKKNVQRTLAVELQRLSVDFRKQQKQYLNRLRGKETTTPGASMPSLLDIPTSSTAVGDDFDPGFSNVQSMKVDTMSTLVDERDREVVRIVTSINELAQIMKDLSVLVIDQGTILDRIDYNLEQTSARVEEGVTQLQRAERAQKRGAAATCVMILLAAVAFLLVFILLKTLLISM